MSATINCPGSVAPGSTVQVNGTVDDCEGAAHSVIHNASPVAHQWACTSGDFRVEFKAPACVNPPLFNVVTVVVDDASCDIVIHPCG